MDARGLPAAVRAAATDRRGGAMEVAATALDGLLEVAADPLLLEEAVAVLLAGQPAMAPIWHLALAARDPDPPPPWPACAAASAPTPTPPWPPPPPGCANAWPAPGRRRHRLPQLPGRPGPGPRPRRGGG